MHVKTETWRQLRFISLDYRETSGQYWKVTWRLSWKASGNSCQLLFWGTLTLPSDCIPFSSSAVTSAAEPGGSEEGVLWWTQWLSLQKRPTKTCLLLHLHKGSVSRYQLWVRECAPSFHTSASGALILDFCCSQVTKFMALLYDSLNRWKKLARKAERIYAKALSGYCATLVENVWPT